MGKRLFTFGLLLFSIYMSVSGASERSDSTLRRLMSISLASNPVGKIEDEFSVTPMGQAAYEIPIPVPAGTGGVAPKLSITYDSSRKTGLLGYGFDLTGLSIINRTPPDRYHDGQAGLVTFTETDNYSLDGARLILVTSGQANREYRTENDIFSKITAYGSLAAPDSFVVKTKEGLTYTYLSNKLILNNSSTEAGLFWMVTKVKDTCGNYYTVSYIGTDEQNVPLPDNTIYPSRIDYTGNDRTGLVPYASVRIEYVTDTIANVSYVYGKRVKHDKRIQNINVYYGDTLVRSFEATYMPRVGRQVLWKISEIASDGTRKNPTVFDWNSPASPQSSVIENTTSSIHNATLATGDFNGDGATDAIIVSQSTDSGYKPLHLFLGGLSEPPVLSCGTLQFDDEARQVVSGDFNGDGYDDFAVLRFFQYDDESPQNYSFSVYYSQVENGQVSFNLQPSFYNHSYQKFSLQVVEVSGDGMADLLLCYDNSHNYKIYYSDGGSPLCRTVTGIGPVNSQWKRMDTLDANGDGLTDLLAVYDDAVYLLTSTGSGSFTSSQLPHIHLYDWYLGDFNGDGKTDFLAPTNNEMNMNPWFVFLSTGTGNFLTLSIDAPCQALDQYILVADINGDGFDDFYAIPKAPDGNTVTPKAYINDGTGRFNGSSLGISIHSLESWNVCLGDFSGCGKAEMLCTSNGNTTTWDGYKYYPRPYGSNLLLAKVTDGLGNATEIRYGYLSSGVHKRGTVCDYPLTSFSAPWPVVGQVLTPNGIGGRTSKKYTYENALMHRDGRGLLGFEKVIEIDQATQSITTTEYALERNKYVMGVRHTKTKIGTHLVHETDVLYDTLDINQRVFSYLPTATTERTYEYSSGTLISEVHITTRYDNHGNVVKTIADNGDIRTTTENVYADD